MRHVKRPRLWSEIPADKRVDVPDFVRTRAAADPQRCQCASQGDSTMGRELIKAGQYYRCVMHATHALDGHRPRVSAGERAMICGMHARYMREHERQQQRALWLRELPFGDI